MKDLSYKMFFKALANRTRFKIINILRRSPKTVTAISNHLKLEQSLVSHNMKCLIDCGFVVSKQDGKNKIYSLEKETIMPLLDLIDRHIDKYSAHLRACGVLEK
jgi:DNA-binding transcriptional ArsR family regulator